MKQFIQNTKISILASIIFIPTFILFYILEYFIHNNTHINILIADSLGVIAVGICLILKENQTKHSS